MEPEPKPGEIPSGRVYDTSQTRMSVLFLILIFELFLGNRRQVPLLILSGAYLSLCYFLLHLQMFRSIKFRSAQLHLDIYFYKGEVLTEVNRETIFGINTYETLVLERNIGDIKSQCSQAFLAINIYVYQFLFAT